MRGSFTAWARGVAALTALMTVLTFGAPPCDASDASSKPASPRPSEKRSLSASADAHVAAMAPLPRAALAQDPATSAAAGDSQPFLRSPGGIAAIVLMVVGAGYVAYKIPKDNDKVHSPIR